MLKQKSNSHTTHSLCGNLIRYIIIIRDRTIYVITQLLLLLITIRFFFRHVSSLRITSQHVLNFKRIIGKRKIKIKINVTSINVLLNVINRLTSVYLHCIFRRECGHHVQNNINKWNKSVMRKKNNF